MEEIRIGNVRIVEYSEKSIAVYGDTKPYKETMKECGGHFNQRLRDGAGWIFSKKRRDLIVMRLRNEIKEEEI